MLPNSGEDERLAEVAAIGRIGANGALSLAAIEHIQLNELKGNAQAPHDSKGVLLLEISLEGGFHQIGLNLAASQMRSSQKTGRVAAPGKGHSQARSASKEIPQRLSP